LESLDAFCSTEHGPVKRIDLINRGGDELPLGSELKILALRLDLERRQSALFDFLLDPPVNIFLRGSNLSESFRADLRFRTSRSLGILDASRELLDRPLPLRILSLDRSAKVLLSGGNLLESSEAFRLLLLRNASSFLLQRANLLKRDSTLSQFGLLRFGTPSGTGRDGILGDDELSEGSTQSLSFLDIGFEAGTESGKTICGWLNALRDKFCRF
jgi:hypothetical protein